MPKPTPPQPSTAPLQPTAAAVRRDRQKAALKANMARRKAHAHAQAQGQALAEYCPTTDMAAQTAGTGADTGTDLDKSKD